MQAHPSTARLLESKVLEQTREDVDCPSARLSREGQLSLPPPELGDRSLSEEGVQTADGHQRQQHCPNQSLSHIKVFRSELFERLARCEFKETEFHFPPHRIQARHFFRGQHLGPEVHEAEVVLSGLRVALQGGSPDSSLAHGKFLHSTVASP